MDSDNDTIDGDGAFNFEDDDAEAREESSDEEASRPSPVRSKAVSFKLHTGAARIAKEKRYARDPGTGRVTRSNVGKTRLGSSFKSSESLKITSPKAKSVLRALSGSLANPETTVAL